MMKKRRNGYSLAELIISMVLIVMVSMSGYMACSLVLSSRKNSERNLQIWSMSDAVYNAFSDAVFMHGKNTDHAEIDSFLSSFNETLSFVLSVKSFNNEFSSNNLISMEKDKDFAWEFRSNSSTVSTDPELSGTPMLHVYHNPTLSRGNPFAYSYHYAQPKFKIKISVMLMGNDYYLDVQGFNLSTDKPIYSMSEVF